MKQKAKGFSLMELLIAIAILGVITAVAIPSYRSFTLKSHRSEAHTALLDISAKQQEYYSENKEYTREVSELSLPVGTHSRNTQTANGYYLIPIAGGSSTWSAEAIPKGSQEADVYCFRINANGEKSTLAFINGACSGSDTPGWK